MSSPTVPVANRVIPAVPTGVSNVFKETNATIVQKAQLAAGAKLRSKNRKQNRFEISCPLTLQFESGTAYNFQGFGPSFDGVHICDDVEISISGKRGSEVRAGFYRPPEF
jgi:hypothetical protein